MTEKQKSEEEMKIAKKKGLRESLLYIDDMGLHFKICRCEVTLEVTWTDEPKYTSLSLNKYF